MTFRVLLSQNAERDVRSILSWIIDRSPDGAVAWNHVWESTLDFLRQRAASFGLAPESEDRDQPIYQVLFKTKRGRRYRALFIVAGNEAIVPHVRGAGQRLLSDDDLRL